jgi:hypothetical protein
MRMGYLRNVVVDGALISEEMEKKRDVKAELSVCWWSCMVTAVRNPAS